MTEKKNIRQMLGNVGKSISWKSPRVLGGLLIVIVVIGGSTYYLTTAPSATTVMNNEKQELKAPVNGYSEAYVLKVNGAVVAVLPTQEDVDKTLKAYQEQWAKPSEQNKVTSVSFAETVMSEKAEVPQSQVQSSDQALKLLIDGKSTTKDYTVQPNDSWWLIARKANMFTKDVLAGNPGATEDTPLQPGQVIKLVDVTPYLTVISKGTYTETETIAYNTVTKIDSSLGSGQRKVQTEGSNGSKLVTYSYEQSNGRDINKKVLDEKIIKAPVTKVVSQGPASQPITVGLVASRGSSNSSGIVSQALALVGLPYAFGGTTRSGFDCSGFTQYVFRSSGISLPRTSFEQFASGAAVSKSNLQPGDLVFFTTYAKGASHVGVYIGGGRFVHADNPRLGVTTTSMSEGYYASRYLGARRY